MLVKGIKTLLRPIKNEIMSRYIVMRTRDRWVSYGKEYPEKTFYIIGRYPGGNGIGSNVLVFLQMLKNMECDYPDAIPVIDMLNYPQAITERKGNAWDYFFEQPNHEGFDLSTISKCKRALRCCSPHVLESTIDFSKGADFNRIKQEGWDQLYKKYFRIRPELIAKFEEDWKKLFPNGNERVLAVKARGTDYVEIKPTGHAIQPTAEQLIEKIDEKMQEGNYQYIFLATEDEQIYRKLKDRYGPILIKLPKLFYSYVGGAIVNSYEKVDGISAHQVSMDYLEEMYLLSKCNALVAGRTSGIIMILFENGWKYEDIYLFDLGVY